MRDNWSAANFPVSARQRAFCTLAGARLRGWPGAGPGVVGFLAMHRLAGNGTLRQTAPVDQVAVTSGTVGVACACCGKPVPEGNLAWDYPAPDPVAYISDDALADRVAFRSQRVMSITGVGNFIYVILPVPVEHDREATLGIWLNVPEMREWRRIMEAGRQGGDAWAGLAFAGRVATAVQPWPQVFGAWAQARVPGPGQSPRLTDSHDPQLARVLASTWPEGTIRCSRNGHKPGVMTNGPTPNPYAD
jgi:hypothetical protein